MKPLETFADQHPLIAGSLGVLSGVGSALLKGIHVTAGIAADVGAIAAGGTSILMFLIVARRWWRDRAQSRSSRK